MLHRRQDNFFEHECPQIIHELLINYVCQYLKKYQIVKLFWQKFASIPFRS